MMVGFYDVVIPAEMSLKEFFAAPKAKTPTAE